ncbi:diphthine methyl ester synthase isoform X2 [Betta splendens]|uniref:diphthine methyl ester synthase n=1 Tax=Betta splendens TaxID=158456 RepID=A0A6P7M6W3_BETSP|nr:diphthine methyl ester synthase isoform X2 [Betta splendens]
MLYLIGLGLGDATDITVKGLQAVKKCSRVYLEAYTSILTVGKEVLEFYGKQLILADRDLVEQGADEILKDAEVTDVAFLVVGDPFGATTHSDLVLRAANAGIPYKVIHNASVLSAVGCCGLQLYNFGETVSLVFWTDTWRPESFYDKICKNRTAGLHTLCLMDIKVKEQSIENMMRGKMIYEPPRFMTVAQAADQLIQIIERRKEEGEELDSSPSWMSPTTVLSSAYFRSFRDGSPEGQSLVSREKSSGERTHPCGTPVLMVRVPDVRLPSLTCSLLSVRKPLIHWHMGSGTVS